MIELARLKSIGDAILLSGDEDVRVGVQIAQNYGVRVHLLGITPIRGSQSQQLMQEADTTTEWGIDTVKTFLSVREEKESVVKVATAKATSVPVAGETHNLASIELTVTAFVDGLGKTDVEGIIAYWETDRGVPAELDKKLLPICGSAIGAKLTTAEIRYMRATFQKAVKAKI